MTRAARVRAREGAYQSRSFVDGVCSSLYEVRFPKMIRLEGRRGCLLLEGP